MTFFHDWREFAAALRLAQCKEEARRQDVAVPSWTGTQMVRPFNPEEDQVGGDEGLTISCAVSAPMWNLLNNQVDWGGASAASTRGPGGDKTTPGYGYSIRR